MLIAEFGNCHMGSLSAAKDLIRAASDHGADVAKGQAFLPHNMRHGSMPYEFYELCSFTLEEYIELIDYGTTVGIEVFFSIFDEAFYDLAQYQIYNKVAAVQDFYDMPYKVEDLPKTIVSINPYKSKLYNLSLATILYATPYYTENEKTTLSYIVFLEEYYRRKPGLSDHNIGLNICRKAIDDYGVKIIEKHFTLDKNLDFNGKVFRDTIHACDPTELEELARLLKK